MIELSRLNCSEGSGLSYQKGVLKITKTVTDVILIDENIIIEVLNGASVSFLEKAMGKQITLTLSKGSVVEYQMINSYYCKRIFHNAGVLDIMGICLEETNEELQVYNISENASVNVWQLAIGNSFSMKFCQHIFHEAKNSYSNISNYGVAVEKSDIIFDTTGSIASGMAKSVCKQLSKGIIMDDASSVTSKPNLLIDEYDVVANHGASIGKMSDESLFYLMSRGLSRYEAFLLILEGIIEPFIAKIKVETLKQEIDVRLKSLIKR